MTPPSRTRIAGVDVARGLALGAMVVFHTAWDLHAFGLTDIDPATSVVWQVFGNAIASVFLFLSGLGLVLARDRGTLQALKRLGVIAAAALVVTIVTTVMDSDQPVLFGILHCIAVCDLIALPMVRAPIGWSAAIAAGALVAPWLVSVGPASLWWLGLSSQIPATLDYRPVLPWLGLVLLGVVVGRCGGGALMRRAGALSSRAGRLVSAAGRHSLVVYLVHQPMLFALFAALTSALPKASPAIGEAAFLERCSAACGTRTTAELCRFMCACAQRRLAKQDISRPDQPGLSAAVRACVSGENPATPEAELPSRN